MKPPCFLRWSQRNDLRSSNLVLEENLTQTSVRRNLHGRLGGHVIRPPSHSTRWEQRRSSSPRLPLGFRVTWFHTKEFRTVTQVAGAWSTSAGRIVAFERLRKRAKQVGQFQQDIGPRTHRSWVVHGHPPNNPKTLIRGLSSFSHLWSGCPGF